MEPTQQKKTTTLRPTQEDDIQPTGTTVRWITKLQTEKARLDNKVEDTTVLLPAGGGSEYHAKLTKSRVKVCSLSIGNEEGTVVHFRQFTTDTDAVRSDMDQDSAVTVKRQLYASTEVFVNVRTIPFPS